MAQWFKPSLGSMPGLLLIGALLVFATTVVTHMSFVPVWDGRFFFDTCLVPALRPRFSLLRLNCNNHPSMLYMLLVALPQYLDLGNTYLLHAVNLVLGLVALWSFHRIAAASFPSQELGSELSVVTAIFAGYPLFLANAMNLNMDYGMVTFFLAFLALLLSGRKIFSLPAGVCLVFSKEAGILLYAVSLFLYFVCFVGGSQRTLRQKLTSILRVSYLGVPPILFCAYLLYKAHYTTGPVLWSSGGDMRLGALLRAFTSFSLLDEIFLSYARGVFVINFNWIFGAALLALLVTRLGQATFGLRRTTPKPVDTRCIVFLASLFLATLFLLTRFQTFTNLRYLLPVYPLLILSAYYSLLCFVRNGRARMVLLACVFALVYASNFRTLDPVSKALYGTFNFGTHPMLNMTRLTGECCGYGRDQLVYNLEYLKLDEAQSKMYQEIKPVWGTTYVAHSLADWFLFGRVDTATYKRTLRPEGSAVVFYANAKQVYKISTKPRVIYYVEYPNFDNSGDLRLLSRLYRDEGVMHFGSSGYYVAVHMLVLRS